MGEFLTLPLEVVKINFVWYEHDLDDWWI